MRAAATCVALLALAPRPARGAPAGSGEGSEASAETAYERARRLFAAEEYLAAADALEEAYALDPNPSYLYQRGHALRLAGSCAAALPVFREVQELAETPAQREEVQPWIEQCERVVEEATPASPPSPRDAAQPAAPAEVEETTAPGPMDSEQPPVRKDLLGGVAVGVGAVLVLAGGGTLTGAAVLANQPSGEPEIDYERRGDRVRGLEISGGVLLGVGAVALIAGVVRYGIVARRRRSTSADASPGLVVRF